MRPHDDKKLEIRESGFEIQCWCRTLPCRETEIPPNYLNRSMTLNSGLFFHHTSKGWLLLKDRVSYRAAIVVFPKGLHLICSVGMVTHCSFDMCASFAFVPCSLCWILSSLVSLSLDSSLYVAWYFYFVLSNANDSLPSSRSDQGWSVRYWPTDRQVYFSTRRPLSLLPVSNCPCADLVWDGYDTAPDIALQFYSSSADRSETYDELLLIKLKLYIDLTVHTIFQTPRNQRSVIIAPGLVLGSCKN